MAVGCIVRTSYRAFRAEAFTLQENGRLRCPAGASLWLSEVRQENAFTRARCLPGLPDRLSAVFPAGAVPGIRGQRRSGAPRQCCPPSLACTCRCCAQAHHARSDAALVDVAGRALRRAWIARLPPTICGGASLGSNPAGGQASSSSTPCRPFASSLALAGSARTQRLVGTPTGAHYGGFRTRVSRHQLTKEELANTETFPRPVISPLS